VTAGASAPESAVVGVVDRLRPRDGVTVVRNQDEDERFSLPRELRARVSSALERGALPPALAAAARLGPGMMSTDELLDVVERVARG
jgi:hypothetical protein